MRFKISLHPEKARFKLPYNYNYPLASAIYSFLGKGDASFSDFLHAEVDKDGRFHKLFLSPEEPEFSRILEKI